MQVPITAGDTLFIGLPGTYLEIDYVKTYFEEPVLPTEIFLAYNFYAHNTKMDQQGWNDVNVASSVSNNSDLVVNSVDYITGLPTSSNLTVVKAPGTTTWGDTGQKGVSTPSYFPATSLVRGFRINSSDTLTLRIDSLEANEDYAISLFATTMNWTGSDTLISITNKGLVKHGNFKNNQQHTFEFYVQSDANGNIDFSLHQFGGSQYRWDICAM